MENVLLLLPFLILMGILALLLIARRRDQRRWDLPFQDDHERPPAESLRKRMDALSDELNNHTIVLLAAACIPFPLLTVKLPLPAIIGAVGFLIPLVLYYGYRFSRGIVTLRCHRIGFEGERLTAQYLQPLLCRGYLVFHDIPMGAYNVDHVVVGPTGVYAIETKTRRKRRSAGTKRARVTYDGRALRYPEQPPETHGIEAAVSRARGLRDWLSSAIGEPVWVQPVLALPGWYVEWKGRGELPVMNPKSIPNFITRRSGTHLDEQTVRRIRHQLFERSKVEAKR